MSSKRNFQYLILLLIISNSILVFSSENRYYQEKSVSTLGSNTINLILPSGDFTITGSKSDKIQAQAVIKCKKRTEDCLDFSKNFQWISKTNNKVVNVELTSDSISNYQDVEIDITIKVPANLDLQMEVDFGDLKVSGLEACLTAQMKAGSMNIEMEEKKINSVFMKVSMGDVGLHTSTGYITGNRSLFGAELNWKQKNTKQCHVDLKLNAGDIKLKLI